MDNTNQQVPPVPSQPPVKTSNNLSFFKTLAYGFVIVSIGISIAIGGYLLGAYKTKPQPAAQTSVTPVLSPTPDPTANWKTYSNSQSNFTFRYPLDWDVAQLDLATPSLLVAPKINVEALRKVNFQVGAGKTSVMTIIGPSYASSADAFVSDATKSVISKSVTIAGLTSTEYTTTYKADFPGIRVSDVTIHSIVENDGKKYGVILVDTTYRDIYYQILSTFKFTN